MAPTFWTCQLQANGKSLKTWSRDWFENFGKIEKNICGLCQLGKRTKSIHPKVNVVATSRPLELLHVDLIGPMRTESMGGKRYIMVVVDDFSRYSWMEFL